MIFEDLRCVLKDFFRGPAMQCGLLYCLQLNPGKNGGGAIWKKVRIESILSKNRAVFRVWSEIECEVADLSWCFDS